MRSKLDVSTPPKAGNETINKLLKICAEMGCTFHKTKRGSHVKVRNRKWNSQLVFSLSDSLAYSSGSNARAAFRRFLSEQGVAGVENMP